MGSASVDSETESVTNQRELPTREAAQDFAFNFLAERRKIQQSNSNFFTGVAIYDWAEKLTGGRPGLPWRDLVEGTVEGLRTASEADADVRKVNEALNKMEEGNNHPAAVYLTEEAIAVLDQYRRNTDGEDAKLWDTDDIQGKVTYTEHLKWKANQLIDMATALESEAK